METLLSLDIPTLRSLVPLAEKRQALLEELSTIEAKMLRVLSGTPPPVATSARRPVRASAKTNKIPRGELKVRILALLESAGEAGLPVSQIASQLSLPSKKVHAWFATTGKALPQIVKAGKAAYALKAVHPVLPPIVAPDAPPVAETHEPAPSGEQ